MNYESKYAMWTKSETPTGGAELVDKLAYLLLEVLDNSGALTNDSELLEMVGSHDNFEMAKEVLEELKKA
jgi:hypothetical protein